MKEDVIRSLQARLELLSDELRQSSSEEEVKEVETGKKEVCIIFIVSSNRFLWENFFQQKAFFSYPDCVFVMFSGKQ